MIIFKPLFFVKYDNGVLVERNVFLLYFDNLEVKLFRKEIFEIFENNK